MANSVQIKLRSDGVRALLKSSEVMAECRSHAESMGASLGEGYEVSEYVGTNRVNVSVHAVSDRAKKDNLDNNSMLKAVGNQ
jgi:hypothetical protein